MKNNYLVLRIFTPSVLCFVGLIFINDIDYYPLLFGLIIGFVNWDMHKFKPYLGVVLSLVASYMSYFLAILSIGIHKPIRYVLNEFTKYTIGKDELGIIIIILSPYVVAPLLVFFLYKFVFNIPKTRKTFWIVAVSISLLLGLKLCIEFLTKDYIISFQDYKFLGKFKFWQVIMALSLQLILYQKEIKIFFYKNK